MLGPSRRANSPERSCRAVPQLRIDSSRRDRRRDAFGFGEIDSAVEIRPRREFPGFCKSCVVRDQLIQQQSRQQRIAGDMKFDKVFSRVTVGGRGRRKPTRGRGGW